MSSATVRATFIGSAGVGKTSLLQRHFTELFPVGGVPSQFCAAPAVFDATDGTQTTLVPMDTNGRDEYDRLRPLAYPGTDVFVLCFSIGEAATLERLRSKYLPELASHLAARPTPILLVGLKSDLRLVDSVAAAVAAAAAAAAAAEDTVALETARAFASSIGAAVYLECSAVQQSGLREVIDTLVRIGRQEQKKKKSKCVIL